VKQNLDKEHRKSSVAFLQNTATLQTTQAIRSVCQTYA